ncbi:MAG: redox-sensing transcriptional repressor Rex [Clostridia bacterium]|nr:redox-sensing transcriptional repressor Rex [Clostridia bacterium]
MNSEKNTAPETKIESKTNVPPAVIKRLPRYHRFLGELLREGRHRISSSELSKIMDVTASQIRQDLNCFGGFGQQGYGYNIEYLYDKISELLGVSEGYRAVIVGVGNLGKALAASRMFERRGVKKLALFDVDEEIIGTEVYGLSVYSLDDLHDYCTENKVDIGVLTVPKEAAPAVANMLVHAGVRGIWNFANTEISMMQDGVVVENIHLGDSLMTLCYEIKSQSDSKKDEE